MIVKSAGKYNISYFWLDIYPNLLYHPLCGNSSYLGSPADARIEIMVYLDIHDLLNNWDFDPRKISVRKILGTDNKPYLQTRVELGIIQMTYDGRPDGKRPKDCDSLLEHYQSILDTNIQNNKTESGFVLHPNDCADLRYEASLYHRRFVAAYVLEEHDIVVRDTSHVLAILDLCKKYAFDVQDRITARDRALTIMIQARSQARLALAENELTSALAHVNRGIMDIQNLVGPQYRKSNANLKVLRTLAKEIGSKMSPIRSKKTRLQLAIEEERYEDAAKFRDEGDNHEQIIERTT